jgi:hypothetical protein
MSIYSIDPCFVAGFLIPDVESLSIWAQEMLQIQTTEGVPLISIKAASAAAPEPASVVDIEDDTVAIDFEPI